MNLLSGGYFVKHSQMNTQDSFGKRNNLTAVRCVKLAAVFLATGIVLVGIPELRQNSASDVYLQVPAETVSIAEFEEFNPEGIVTLTDRGTNSGILGTSIDGDLSAQNAVIDNTFTITQQINEEGIPEELLAISEFTLDTTPVYVSATELNVRSAPSADAEIIATLHYSDTAIRVAYGSSWSCIQMEDMAEGYVVSSMITTDFIATPTPTPRPTNTPTPTPVVTETSASGTYYAIGEVNVRTGPGTQYDTTRKLVAGEAIEVVAKTSNGWFKTVVGTYVKCSLVSSSQTPAPQTGTTPTNPTPTTPGTSTISIPDPSTCDIATYAKAFIGVPYHYTGCDISGMDCSGFVMYVYANYYHISLPHQSASIASMGTNVMGQELLPGDVICHDYNGDGRVDHVSLYIGNGETVHASSSNRMVIGATYPMQSMTSIRRFF